jgi:trehalose-6-phosphate synthase
MPTRRRIDNRLVIVSNRLSVVLERGPDGRWRARPGSGGLVTALAPVLRDRGGLWIGWPGVCSQQTSWTAATFTRQRSPSSIRCRLTGGGCQAASRCKWSVGDCFGQI